MALKLNNLDFQYLFLLRTIQELHEKKQQLQTCLSNGYFCMSKARYVMGIKRISKLNYAAVMNAQTTVGVEHGDEEGFSFNVSCDKKEKKESTKNEISDKENDLKKRNVKSNNDDSLDMKKSDEDANTKTLSEWGDLSSAITEIAADDELEEITPVDPLNWFGVLVPQTLRQCQIEFRKAAIIAGDIVSLESKLKLTETKIKALISEIQS